MIDTEQRPRRFRARGDSAAAQARRVSSAPHQSDSDRRRGHQRGSGRAATSCPQAAVIRPTFYTCGFPLSVDSQMFGSGNLTPWQWIGSFVCQCSDQGCGQAESCCRARCGWPDRRRGSGPTIPSARSASNRDRSPRGSSKARIRALRPRSSQPSAAANSWSADAVHSIGSGAVLTASPRVGSHVLSMARKIGRAASGTGASEDRLVGDLVT
jgi:hypothetical protein